MSRYAHSLLQVQLQPGGGYSLALQGPAHMVSTACSSSAKVYATAERLISLGLIDAAVKSEGPSGS